MTERQHSYRAGIKNELGKPRDISAEKYARSIIDLVCAIGNNEVKALLVSTLGSQPDATFGYAPYYSNIPNFEMSDELRPSRSRQFLQRTLVPAGIIDSVEFPRILQGKSGYRLSEYGNEIGISFAGYMLDFSLRHEPSLEDFLGRTQDYFSPKSTANPPPQTRIGIFDYLLSNSPPFRLADVSSFLNQYRANVGQHLQRLNDTGIIDYNHTVTGRPILEFRLHHTRLNKPILAADEAMPSYITISELVYEQLLLNESSVDSDWLNIENVVDRIYDRAKELEVSTNIEYLKHTIGAILRHFKKLGITNQKDESTTLYSSIELTDDQRSSLQELINIFREFQNPTPEFLKEGKRKALEIVRDPEKVRILVEKAQRKRAA